MITTEKIKIYKYFDGDGDGWARLGNKHQLQTMADKDWATIDNLLQGLTIVKNGLASPEFTDNINKRLVEHCDNADTLKQLKELADKK